MAVSKVVYGGETLVDLTEDTVTEDALAKGVTAHNAAGAAIEGTFEDAIQHIKVNGAEQEITDQTVDISVPTKVGELENDVPYAAQDELSSLASNLAKELFGGSNYTQITSGSDLNDYTEAGIYYGDSTTMQSLDNRPIAIGNYSLMLVIQATSNRVIQIIFEHGTGCARYRLSNSSKVFTFWHTVFGSKRISTAGYGIDMNDLVEEGVYWVQSNVDAANTPVSVTGSVRVTRCYPDPSSNTFIEQEWHNLYNSDRYWRCCNTGNWSEWESLKFTASYDAGSETLALS